MAQPVTPPRLADFCATTISLGLGLGMSLNESAGGGAPASNWILATGLWDDSKVWDDTATWRDA